MKFKIIKKFASIFLWLTIIVTNISAAFYHENILLVTYGEDAHIIEGDNDHEQEILIRIPKKIKKTLYLRLFDPDVGGDLDDKFSWKWDTQTQFTLFGNHDQIIASETFGIDKSKNKKWHTLSRFTPKEGELKDGYYLFKFHIKGLAGDDGNVFDIFVSQYTNKNKKPKGVELWNYEPTVRLPKEKVSAELRFFIPAGTSEINIRNFDLANANIRINTAFRSDLRGTPSGQGEWSDCKIRVMEDEAQKWASIKYTGGNEMPNDATFVLVDDEDGQMAIKLPVFIEKKKNNRPIPQIDVKYLSDCYSVIFDGSKSTDKDGDKLTYFWKFGDGTTENGPRVTHKYDNLSDFEVTLIVTDDSGHVDNSSLTTTTIHLNQSPVSVIRYRLAENENQKEEISDNEAQIAVPDQEILFDGLGSEDADGNLQSYFWNFGDKQSSEGELVSHKFRRPGTYKVSLKVEDDSGVPCNHHTSYQKVIVNASPFVRIGKKRIIGAVGEPLLFEKEIARDRDGEITQYIWEMGDGTSKEGETVTHSYQKPGKYQVTLTVKDNADVKNSTASDHITAIINHPPVANFEIRNSALEIQDQVAVGERVHFDGSLSSDKDGKIIAYAWDFGDKLTGTGKKVTHQYEQPGTYLVTLTVEDNSQTSSATASETLTIIVNEPPIAKFEIRNSKFEIRERVAAGETVHFDASPSLDNDGNIISYSWDFGDKGSGKGEKITHVYDKPGKYNVVLTVQDDSPTLSSTQSVTLPLIVNYPPKADAGQDQMVTGSTVRFDGSGSTDPDGKITAYDWDFGDGEKGNGLTPTHIFKNPGTYLVKLTVTDDSETITNQDQDDMRVIINHNPIADAGPDQIGVPGQPIEFNAAASFDPDGSISKYEWDFGDGTPISSEAKSSHIYEKPGTYMARLTVYDNTDHAEAMNKDYLVVFINAPPVARINSQSLILNSQLIAAPDQPIFFDASDSYDSDGKIVTYRWDFASSASYDKTGTDIEALTGTQISKTYSKPGIYSVILTVSDDSGAANAYSQDKVLIRINHPPDARPGIYQSGIRNLESGIWNSKFFTCQRTIQFDGSASVDPDGDSLHYEWDFGDGTPRKSGIKVIHTYKEGGTYPVVLTADDGTGLANSKHNSALMLTINEPPVADAGKNINLVKTGICAGNVVVFSGGSSFDPEGGLLKYFWDFGDGSTAEGLSATKVFKKGGTYPVTLTVEDDSGLECSRSSDQMIVRVAESPIADAGSDLTVCANTEVHFDGSESYDTDGVVNSFLWEFGDGATGTGMKPSYIYTEPGIYLVKLTITGDSIGICNNEDTTEIMVTVQESPESIFTYPAVIPIGSPATFDGSGSKRNKANIVSWKWDFGDNRTGAGKKVTHTYQKSGKYAVRLTVRTDSKLDCNTVTSQQFIIVNESPVADAGGDRFAGINEPILFDATKSHDPDGAIVSYEWDFGDGKTDTGFTVRHSYQAGGNYPVKLTVIDNTDTENNRAEDTITVTVNHTPIAMIEIEESGVRSQNTGVRSQKSEYRSQESGVRIQEPTANSQQLTANTKHQTPNTKQPQFKGCAGEKIRFSARNSTDPDRNLLENKKSRYEWDFGDGQSAKGLNVSHRYAMPGIYCITLIVDDGTNVSNSKSETHQTIIINAPPVADTGKPAQIMVCPGEAVTFDGSKSVDPDGTRLTYHWNFGDGDMSEGEKVSHTFEKSGIYKLRLTVFDDADTHCNTSKDTIIVKVNTPPIAVAGKDQKGFIGGAHDAFFFDAAKSYDPDGDPLTCYWDFGDGNKKIGDQVFHAYKQPGNYKVRLQVRDGSGAECGEGWDELDVEVVGERSEVNR